MFRKLKWQIPGELDIRAGYRAAAQRLRNTAVQNTEMYSVDGMYRFEYYRLLCGVQSNHWNFKQLIDNICIVTSQTFSAMLPTKQEAQ